MKKKIVWLVVSCLMVAALLLSSCAPAVVEEEKVAPPKEKEEVVVPEKEVVVPKEGAEMVKLTLTKLDGTVVEKMVEKPRYGGIFRASIPTGKGGMDEVYTVTWHSWSLRLTNEDLITGDWTRSEQGTGEFPFLHGMVQPIWATAGAIAESWEIPDPDTLVFHIRKGIHFALNPTSAASRLVGGREANAYDAEYSINRALDHPHSIFYAASYPRGDPKNPKPGDVIYSITATDKWTLVMKFAPGQMGRGYPIYADDVRIIPREVVEKYGDMRDWRNSVGTGPFMMVDFIDESSTTFVRNPNYWEKDPLHPENRLPYLDGVKWLVIPDKSTQLAAMRTAKIDQIETLGWEDSAGLMKTNPELKYVKSFGGAILLFWRVDKPALPWYDIRVRRALTMAINNREIIDDYYEGNAVMLTLPTQPMEEFRGAHIPLEELPEEVRELYEYHPDKAKQLLAEAGYPQGFKAAVIARADMVDSLSIIKDYWAKVGVDLKIEVKEAAVWLSMRSRHTYEEAIATDGGSGDPYRFIYHMPGQAINFSRSNDLRLQKVGEAMSAAWFDWAERDRLLKEITPYLLGQAYELQMPLPYVYTFWQPWVKVYSGELRVGYIDYYGWTRFIWVDQELKEAMTGRR